jgi:hypothetical protein
MSGSPSSDLWTDEALSSDPRWEEVRTLAKAALVSFGWPIEIPLQHERRMGCLSITDHTSSRVVFPPRRHEEPAFAGAENLLSHSLAF